VLLASLLVSLSEGGGEQLATASASPLSPTSAPPVPTALFVLGDSLSDVGNAAGGADYLLNLVLQPPTVGLCNLADVLVLPRGCSDLFYRQSRVSDGPVAVEHLAMRLGLPELEPSLHLLPRRPTHGTVYAVASAKARGQRDGDFEQQVDWLLLDHAPLPADAVYVIMIGGNDAIDALQANVASPAVYPRPGAAIVTAAVGAIRDNVERLVDLGARRVVVANVPDLATLPAVRSAAFASANEAALLAEASAISATLDRELDESLDALEARWQWLAPTTTVIQRFDLRAALAAAQQATAARGGNPVDACFFSESYLSSASAERSFHTACAPTTAGAAPRFAEFAFWDGIHPTGAAHAAIGDALSALF
jgi:thermolabile hemolysin